MVLSRYTHQQKVSKVLLFSILLATYLNGLPHFLRRIGILDRSSYLQDLSIFCVEPIWKLWLPASCHYRKIISNAPLDWITINVGRIYSISLYETPLKLLKYCVLLAILIYSLLILFKGETKLLSIKQLLPVFPLLLGFLISFLQTLLRHGPILALAGSASYSWLFLLPLCSWLLKDKYLQSVSDSLLLIIFSLLPLALIEAMIGLPTPFGSSHETLFKPSFPLPSRLSQIFVQPNSLGVFLILALTFCLIFSRRPWLFPWLNFFIIPLMLLARSGTGILTLTIVSFIIYTSRSRYFANRKHRRLSVQLAILFTMAIITFTIYLPSILGRSDLWNSVIGRVGAFSDNLQDFTLASSVFGQGVMISGSFYQLLHNFHFPFHFSLSSAVNSSFSISTPTADSTIQNILIQQGIFGIISFYGLLLWSCCIDVSARPFYIALILCSLTLKIEEIFPIPLLLAITLNRSLQTYSSSHSSCDGIK